MQPDLLLDRDHPGDRAGEAAALGASAGDLERDVGAEPVVHRPRDEPAAGQCHGLAGDHRRVADPDHPQRLVAVGGADVEVQAVELDRLLSLVVLQQVDRPCDRRRRAPGRRSVWTLEPLADEDLWVPAADRGEVGESLLVDVGDRKADLVDVADDGDQRPGVGLADPDDRRPEPVGLELAERGGLPPDGGRGRLVAGGAGG